MKQPGELDITEGREEPTSNPNNPYHRVSGFYETNLSLPFISAIRRQEARAVGDFIARYTDKDCRVLEVGPGTGFYTLKLAKCCREVVAIEDSAGMAQILQSKLQSQASNVTVINKNFLSLPVEGAFDVAVAIGVLDYIAEPAAFVAKLCAAARRAVILTVPRRGLWGACFAAGSKLRKIKIYRYDRAALRALAPDWRGEITEVGLKTPFTKGMTLVAAFERP